MRKAKSEKTFNTFNKINANKSKSIANKKALKPIITVLPDDARLNRYVAHSGICSRRKADDHIKAGEVRVNKDVVYEPGYRLQKGDKVYFQDKLLAVEKKVYILLNKPRGYITTTQDEKERKTVMDLVGRAHENLRVYPVGRLDRNTTGLLLLTNDGDLAQQLSHPSGNIIKVYQAELDKPITYDHLDEIRKGIQLEDGIAVVDEIDITHPPVDARFVGVAIHIGKNRIVRRIFEHLGYDVVKLDRVSYAGLTKKDLPRGKWRYLDEKEVIFLKHLKAGTRKK